LRTLRARSVPRTRVIAARLGDEARPWRELDSADAIVFGCPTYMGSASAVMKAFMEESLRPQWTEQRWKDKLAAGFTNSAGMSGDKLVTLQQLAGFAAQHGMLWLTLGEPPGWQDSSGSAGDINRLASFLGLMTQSNSIKGPTSSHRRATEPLRGDSESGRRGCASLGGRPASRARCCTGVDRAARPAAAASADIVLDAFDAVERRDEKRLLELYHPEVEFHWPPSLPYGGSFRGAEPRPGSEWGETWDPLQPTQSERRLSPRLVAATADEVVVLWRQRGLSATGERFDGEVLGLYQVRDNKFRPRADVLLRHRVGASIPQCKRN
jgi:NAD(P)H dehydrogenase (quinone)